MGAAPAARRCALLLALVVLVAAAGERGGSGAGGEAGAEQVLRLWSSADSARGGEAVDEEDRFFRWEWEEEEEDDDNNDEEEGEEEDDHAVVVQRKGACRNVVNVDSFGAAGDGVADDTQVRARCRSAIDTHRYEMMGVYICVGGSHCLSGWVDRLPQCGWLMPMTPATQRNYAMYGHGGDCLTGSHRQSSLDYQAFASAWKTACSLDNAVFLVPAGRRYKVGAIQFVGPCKDRRMIIQVTRVASVQLNA
jgi:hypothetical protein